MSIFEGLSPENLRVALEAAKRSPVALAAVAVAGLAGVLALAIAALFTARHVAGFYARIQAEDERAEAEEAEGADEGNDKAASADIENADDGGDEAASARSDGENDGNDEAASARAGDKGTKDAARERRDEPDGEINAVKGERDGEGKGRPR